MDLSGDKFARGHRTIDDTYKGRFLAFFPLAFYVGRMDVSVLGARLELKIGLFRIQAPTSVVTTPWVSLEESERVINAGVIFHL